jgi:hypothetical protein
MLKVQGLHSTRIVSIDIKFPQKTIPRNKEVAEGRNLKVILCCNYFNFILK